MEKLRLSDAYFEGHFPGRPVLPGITQLVLAAEAIVGDRDCAVSAIHHVRMRQLVLPGEELLLVKREATDGRMRFELKRGLAVVANGELTLSASLSTWDGAGPSETPQKTFPPIEDLLPHRLPMRFVMRVLDYADGYVASETSIPSACPLVREGDAPAIVAIEAAAQSAAVGETLRRLEANKPNVAPNGYLVSLRNIELAVATVPADAPLIVTVRLQSMVLPLSNYAIEVFFKDGRPVLRGGIGTFLAGA